jgi:Holliday junction resolvase RusA-like endonuclease
MTDIPPPAVGRNSDEHTVIIELPGEPRGKGRPRFVRRTGHAFTPQKTASEACLRHEAALAMADRPPFEGALRVRVAAYFGVPASWSTKKQIAAIAGAIRPAKRPDLDNIVKMFDALTSGNA